MKKLITFIFIALSFVVITGCNEANEFAADATHSFNNLKDGVTDVKENMEGTVKTVQDGVDTVKETAKNVGNTVNQVNQATKSVSGIINNE